MFNKKVLKERLGSLKKNQNYNELMAEVLVGTRELTVTVLKERPLCVTEITSNKKQDFYNYKAKYDQNGSSHIIPALIPKTIFDKAMSWALRAHKIIGCKGISRTDFRYDSNHNKLFMLELNTQPGMTETSLAPEQALFCQITMKQMVKALKKTILLILKYYKMKKTIGLLASGFPAISAAVIVKE